MRYIEKHNARYYNGETTYFMGMNQFADLTDDEFNKYLIDVKYDLTVNSFFKRDPNFITPDSIDWRDQGVVTEVREQKNCSCSWAISTVSL